MVTKFRTFPFCYLLFFITSMLGQTKQDSIFDLIGRQQTVDLNDTNYTRILNGTIVENKIKIDNFGKIQYITEKQEIVQLGIKTLKPLMIINIKKFDIEYKIDSILYSGKDFITNYKYSSDIQLPISINEKLLSYSDRVRILPNLKLNEISEIKYLNRSKSKDLFNNITPFGVINLIMFK